VTPTLVLAGAIALVIFIVWLLVRQSRARGKAEAEAQAATIDKETAADVAEIQARPIPLRHAVLERMRGQPPA
jgi:hypothetical protein